MSREESLNKVRSLEDLIRSKLQEVENRRESNKFDSQQFPIQVAPRQPTAPKQPVAPIQ